MQLFDEAFGQIQDQRATAVKVSLRARISATPVDPGHSFLTYQRIKDQVIALFNVCRQNRSSIAAHVGQALLYSRQPTCDGCLNWDNLHVAFDVMMFKIVGWRRFSMFVKLACATAIQMSNVYSSFVCE